MTKNNTVLTLSNNFGDVLLQKNGGSTDIPKETKGSCTLLCLYISVALKAFLKL